jgi:chromosome segregation ATPase
MVEEKDNAGFRLSFDEEPEEDSDRQIQSEIEDLKVEKLSQRVTIITILIPILIAVIIGVTYLDIKRRVISTATSGSKGFEHLSRDLESRFSSLSLRQATLEENFKKESTNLNEASAKMGVRLKETDTALKTLSDAAVTQKALKKVVSESVAAMDKKLAPLAQQLAAVNEKLTTQISETTASISELEGLIATMDPALADLRTSLQSLSSELETLAEKKISKEQMDLALKLDRFRIISDLEAQDKRLEQQLGEVSRQLTLVRGELAALENRLYPRKSTLPILKPTTKTVVKPTSKPTPEKKPSKEGISEQDLN